jgi:hypothetical protein
MFHVLFDHSPNFGIVRRPILSIQCSREDNLGKEKSEQDQTALSCEAFNHIMSRQHPSNIIYHIILYNNKILKITYLTHMIFIKKFAFTVMFYTMR